METKLDNEQFEQLGEEMKKTWEASTSDATRWQAFEATLGQDHMCARWSITGEGNVYLALEEHADEFAAFWAARNNDGSIEPLRRTEWCKTGEGWVRP